MKFMKSTNDKQSYYKEAHQWSTDTYSQSIVWRSWALLITCIALLIAIIALVALIKLLPLKENTPFLVFVDSQKGEPVTIRPAASETMIENAALKKYMISKFIIARQRYFPATLAEDRQTVSALANETVYQDYQDYLSKGNPMSPNNLYKNSTFDVTDINIIFLNEQRAYVSFTLLVNQEGIIKEIAANADIKFQFSDRLLTLDASQLINPVNFEVLTYQSHFQTNQEEVL